MKEAVTKVIDTLTQKEEVVGMVLQVHCSRRRLFRRGLEFHVCTINKSAHTKKSLETYLMSLVYQIYMICKHFVDNIFKQAQDHSFVHN